jgi:hypothetical protein
MSRNISKIQKRGFEPYRDKKDYLADLSKVFRKDYGVEFSEKELAEIGGNLDAFLGVFC